MRNIIILVTVLESIAIVWVTFYWRSRTRLSTVRVGPPQRSDVPPNTDLAVGVVSTSHEAAHWAFINDWHVTGQRDDRKAMNGSVAVTSGSRSAHRAFARRSHQLNYKQWSQEAEGKTWV
jgi:hypothetical protein